MKRDDFHLHSEDFIMNERSGYRAFFDGACEPINPGGTASYGAIVYRRKRVIWECSAVYDPPEGRRRETTNNVAEYLGLHAVLDFFISKDLTSEDILVQGDSKLVIEQCFGNWKIHIKGRLYESLALQARKKRRLFTNLQANWIPREENTEADKLSKAELLKRNIQFRIQPLCEGSRSNRDQGDGAAS
jgi:ribonuclease HI